MTEIRKLTPAELAYVRVEQHSAPFRMQTDNVEFQWKYYSDFPVRDVVEQQTTTWNVEEWLEEELKDDDYRRDHYGDVLENGVLDPVVILQDDFGFDIADGWHRIAYCYLNNIETIPAYVGYHPGEL